METLKEKISELNKLVLSGKSLEAFEKFYHDDVIMQENDDQPTIGKAANLDREKEFYGNVIEFRSAEVKGVTVGDSITSVVWSYDYSHKEWGVKKYTQLSVQRWKDGKIIKEQFFYN